jgi:hypothetical protein
MGEEASYSDIVTRQEEIDLWGNPDGSGSLVGPVGGLTRLIASEDGGRIV